MFKSQRVFGSLPSVAIPNMLHATPQKAAAWFIKKL
jgi:hypothetical protein